MICEIRNFGMTGGTAKKETSRTLRTSREKIIESGGGRICHAELRRGGEER